MLGSLTDLKSVGVAEGPERTGSGSQAGLDGDLHALQRGFNKYTAVVITTSVMGGLLFGLDIGTTAITSMDSFRIAAGIEPVPLPPATDSVATTNQVALFAVLFHIFSLLGAPISGYVTDRYGRKPVILVASILFFLGALWQSVAGLIFPSFTWGSILLGRCLGGIGNGFILSIMPVYSAELAPSQYRGKVLTCFQLFVTIGIFIMSAVNVAVEDSTWGWRVGISVQCFPCLFIILMTLFVLPESPQFLVKVGKDEQARDALTALCKGSANAAQIVESEFAEMKQEHADAEAIGPQGSMADLFRGTALPATLCGVGVAFCQNILGVNYFINYSPVLFKALGFSPFVFDLILKSINMVATFAAVAVIERTGRKFLTVWGTLMVIVVYALIVIVVGATGVDVSAGSPDAQTQRVQEFIVAMIFCFQIIFAICWGPTGWLVPSECFPVNLRGAGMSLAVMANMGTNIAVGDYGYAALAATVGFTDTMLIVFILCVTIILPVVTFWQLETKSVSLEDMRFLFMHQPGGDASEAVGTMGEFYRKNWYQTMRIVRFKTIDPNAEARDQRLKVEGLHKSAVV